MRASHGRNGRTGLRSFSVSGRVITSDEALWLDRIPAPPPLLAVGVLLAWEHARAEDLDLAFFRIHVWVGFAALATVLAGLAA